MPIALVTPRHPSRPAMPLTRHDRVLGGLLGVACGDALGATVEFLTPGAIQQRYGVHRSIIGGGSLRWRPGQATDDTDQTLAVAQAYVAADGYSLNAVAARLRAWYHGNPVDVGGLTALALSDLGAYYEPRESGRVALDQSGKRGGAGNGSLMRALPTALVGSSRKNRLLEAREISAITHADRRCVTACQAYVELAALLLAGTPVVEALGQVNRLARRRNWPTAVRNALYVDPTLPAWRLCTGGYVVDSLRCAVWALQQDTSPEATLIALVNQGSDADTTGAIAGGLLGVRHGVDAWPSRWVERLEARRELVHVAARLVG